MDKCIFCSNEVIKNTIFENEKAFVVYDKYPQERGHMLIIPKRHSRNLFETTMAERVAILDLVDRVKMYLDEKYKPDGYNILSNIEAIAGQVIFHTHIHVIPRYTNS